MAKNAVNNQSFDYIDFLSLFGVCWKLDGTIVSSGAIWFLMVLFWTKVFLQIALKYRYGIACLVIMAFISILASRFLHIILPFGVQQALPCSLFLYVGYLCNQYKTFDIHMSKVLLLSLILAVLPFLRELSVATRSNSYSLGIISIFVSCALVWMVVMSLKWFTESDTVWNSKLKIKDFLTWCGRCSLVILAVHSIEARYFAYFSPNFMVESIVRLIVILVLSWLCSQFVITRKLFHVK